MIKNNAVLKVLLASLFALVLVVALIYAVVWGNDSKLYGKIVFSNTYNQGEYIDKIVLKNSKDEIVLLQENSYWLLENKNNYYADFWLVNNLLNSINKSIYSVKFPYSKKLADEKYLNNPDDNEENSGILIRTYVKDKIIDEIIVGLPSDDKNYFFARNLKDNNVWLISENFDLPLYAKDWLSRPIFSILTDRIESITIDDNIITCEKEFMPFYDRQGRVVNVDVLLDIFSGINIVDVMNEEDFRQLLSEKADIKTKKIKVVTSYGLIVDFDIYYNGEKLWSNIKLSTSSLPLTAINDYINDSNFLYKGWYFEISSEQGSILRYFSFI